MRTQGVKENHPSLHLFPIPTCPLQNHGGLEPNQLLLLLIIHISTLRILCDSLSSV